MNRRSLLSSASAIAVLPILMAACGTTASATLSAQVIADINGALQGLATLPAQLEKTVPPVITQALGDTIMADIAALQGSMATISASTALQAGVDVMARVFGGMNTAVSVLSAFPVPPPFNMVLMAVAVILPTVQAYLEKYQPAPVPVSPPAAALRAKATAHGISLEKARATLHVATVSN